VVEIRGSAWGRENHGHWGEIHMFDLFRSRSTAVRLMLTVMLGLVAVSMLIYLIPNYFDPAANSANPVLAEIGGQKIYAAEVQRMFQTMVTQQGGQVPPEILQSYFPQYVENVINQRALVHQAKRMGLRVTDSEVRDFMMTTFAQFYNNGSLDINAFQTALAQQGATAETVLEDARNNQMLRKVRDMILENTVVTPQEVEREYRNKYEKASVRYIAISPADLRSKVSATEQEVRDLFEKTKALYNQPAKASFRVIVLEPEKLKAGVEISEQELRSLYASAQDNFRIPERVHARHILVSTQGKSDEEKKALRKKAEDLLAKVKGGADFAQVARENSDDPGTRDNGGDLDFFGQGQMVYPEFDAAAFALKPKEISNIVTTEVGYHIIQVLEKEPARLTPFEQVRAQLEQDVRERKAAEQVDTVSRKVRTELAANAAGAAEIARKYSGELITVKAAAAGDPIPTLGVTPEIDQALAPLQPGGVTDVLAIPGDRLVVAVLDERIPGRPSTFEEAQAQVRDAILNDKAQKLAQDLAKQAEQRLKAREDMNAVAKALGLTVTTSSNFSRTDTIEGLGPAAYLQEAFTAPLATIVGPREIQGRTVIAEIIDRKNADMSNFVFERDQLLQSLKSARAQERLRLFEDSVVAKLIDEGEVKIYRDQIQLATNQFAQ
jgi:peptidyl-prolyl cis-trans isomerase D